MPARIVFVVGLLLASGPANAAARRSSSNDCASPSARQCAIESVVRNEGLPPQCTVAMVNAAQAGAGERCAFTVAEETAQIGERMLEREISAICGTRRYFSETTTVVEDREDDGAVTRSSNFHHEILAKSYAKCALEVTAMDTYHCREADRWQVCWVVANTRKLAQEMDEAATSDIDDGAKAVVQLQEIIDDTNDAAAEGPAGAPEARTFGPRPADESTVLAWKQAPLCQLLYNDSLPGEALDAFTRALGALAEAAMAAGETPTPIRFDLSHDDDGSLKLIVRARDGGAKERFVLAFWLPGTASERVIEDTVSSVARSFGWTQVPAAPR